MIFTSQGYDAAKLKPKTSPMKLLEDDALDTPV